MAAAALLPGAFMSTFELTTHRDIQLMAPISNPEKLICNGLNYSDHAKECGLPLPERPVVFSKFSNAIIGPDDAIKMPRNSEKIDYGNQSTTVLRVTCLQKSRWCL